MAQFTNQAQLSYNNSVTSSNIAVGEIIEVLSVTKTAVIDTYSQNDNITYIISIINSGSVPISGLTITDNLGSYISENNLTLIPLTYVDGSVRYYVGGVLQPVPTVTSSQPLIISGINVPAGGNAIIIYEASANNFAPLSSNSNITNEAVISGNNLTPITATETVSVLNTANLGITKSISPVPVTENGQLTYTFYIQNTGNTAADASANVVVTDTFDPILTNLSVALDGTALPATAYSYDEATGEFATSPGAITVPAATYTQDPTDGRILINPGITTLVVTGTV